MSLKALVASCIVREPIVSHSGLDLSWWLDLRRASERLGLVADAFQPAYIPVGIETMGWEIAAILKRPRAYPSGRLTKDGTLYLEYGESLLGNHVSLIDDVVTTEASLRDARDALEPYHVAEYLCVMDRRLPDEKALEIRSLFTPEDFGLAPR